MQVLQLIWITVQGLDVLDVRILGHFLKWTCCLAQACNWPWLLQPLMIIALTLYRLSSTTGQSCVRNAGRAEQSLQVLTLPGVSHARGWRKTSSRHIRLYWSNHHSKIIAVSKMLVKQVKYKKHVHSHRLHGTRNPSCQYLPPGVFRKRPMMMSASLFWVVCISLKVFRL